MALLLDLGSAANVLSRLHADDLAAACSTPLLVAAVAPNAVLLSAPTCSAPASRSAPAPWCPRRAVVLGPVPAFPLLAALPVGRPAAGAGWPALVAVPVLAGLRSPRCWCVRRFPGLRPVDADAVRGLGSGVLGGLLVTVLVACAGGAVGPGRMADLGADAARRAGRGHASRWASVACVGGVGAGWWERRRRA